MTNSADHYKSRHRVVGKDPYAGWITCKCGRIIPSDCLPSLQDKPVTNYYSESEDLMNNNNTGDNNSGNWNSGNWNSGDRNSGNWNSGYGNSGNWNSGNWNSGDRNSGNWNSGYGNSGDWNSGYGNSGDWNSGNWNSGYGNSTNRSAGIFCSTEATVRVFNKETNLKWDEIDHPHFNEFYLNRWISELEMTDEEKKAEPEFHIRDGYLKTYDWDEAWANFWRDTDEKNRQKVLNLPNFDAQIFKEITGIDVGNNSKKQELLTKADELIKQAQELRDKAREL